MCELFNYIVEGFNDEQREDRFGNRLYRTLSDYKYFWYLKEKFNLNGCLDAYVGYLYDDGNMILFTYCEGDLYAKQHSSKETYEQDKKETIEWFKEN